MTKQEIAEEMYNRFQTSEDIMTLSQIHIQTHELYKKYQYYYGWEYEDFRDILASVLARYIIWCSVNDVVPVTGD